MEATIVELQNLQAFVIAVSFIALSTGITRKPKLRLSIGINVRDSRHNPCVVEKAMHIQINFRNLVAIDDKCYWVLRVCVVAGLQILWWTVK